MSGPSLSAVIITRNEEGNITACLRSAAFCDEAIVVDSESEDRTVSLARGMGAKVFVRRFDNFADQKNFGISKAAGDWVLLLDADERLTGELKAEIRARIEDDSGEGYYFPRKNRIFGRWMRHGGCAPDFQLRLVKKRSARFEGVVHERIRLEGKPERLEGRLLHFSTPTISAYMKKLNAYTSLESERVLEERRLGGGSLAARSLLRFAYLVFFKRAFLDGMEGFIFAVLSAYYDFVGLAKRWEKRREGLADR